MFELHNSLTQSPPSSFPLIWCTRSSPSPSTASSPPTTTISGNHCSTAPNHRCIPMTTTTTWQINGRATSSRWCRWSLSTLLKVSNLNSPSFSFFIQDTAATSLSVTYQPTTDEWCQTTDNQVSHLTILPSPFVTTEAGLGPQWQCGKHQPSFNHPQPLPNNDYIPRHTTPNDAANNKDTMTTHECPLTKTNQHQPKPTTSIHMNDDQYPGTETDHNEPRWGKLVFFPPPIFLTWNWGATSLLATCQPNSECC